MPRSFEASADSPATVEQVLSAFGDADYWRARMADAEDDAVTVDALSVDPAGCVNVGFTISLLRAQLPKLITQVQRGELKMVHTEVWTRNGDDQVRGEIEVTVRGLRLSALAKALLVPTGSGSRLGVTATIGVKVPLVGGQIENLIGGQFNELVIAIQQFTSEWIAENR